MPEEDIFSPTSEPVLMTKDNTCSFDGSSSRSKCVIAIVQPVEGKDIAGLQYIVASSHEKMLSAQR